MPSVASIVVLTGAALASVGVCALVGGTTAVVVALSLAYLPYAGLLLAPSADPDGPTLRRALLVAALAALPMLAAGSPLSDDVYRYLWDGRQWLSGRDAYALPPSAPALYALRDAHFLDINHRDIPTIYPPLAQGLFALCALLPGLLGFKLLALGAHLGTAVLVRPLAQPLLGPDGGARAALLVALNPLLLSEAALGAHVDACAGLCLCALALCLARGRDAAAAGLVAAATGLKLLGLLLWPVLLRRRRALALLSLGASLLLLWPVTRSGHADEDAAPGLSHYTQRWRGNEGPFLLLELLSDPLVPLVARPVPDSSEVRVTWAEPLLRAAGAFGLGTPRKQVRDPAYLPRVQLRFLLARGLGVAALLAALHVAHRRRYSGPATLRVLLWTLLLTAPQVHPWYLAWLIPLDLALGGRAALLWSATVLVAYAPLPHWQQFRHVATVPATAMWIYLPVLVALALPALERALARPGPSPSTDM